MIYYGKKMLGRMSPYNVWKRHIGFKHIESRISRASVRPAWCLTNWTSRVNKLREGRNVGYKKNKRFKG